MSKNATKNLMGKVIQVDRNGPESKIGKLLHVGDDYIAIFTDEGLVYYNSYHIKSFTEYKSKMKINTEVPEGFEFKKTDEFKGLFESSQYDWIRINRGGPETVEGVLAGLEDDFVILIASDAIVRIALFHIKNVSYGVKSVNNESSSSSSSDESSSSNSSSDESSSSNSSSDESSSSSSSSSDESSSYESSSSYDESSSSSSS